MAVHARCFGAKAPQHDALLRKASRGRGGCPRHKLSRRRIPTFARGVFSAEGRCWLERANVGHPGVEIGELGSPGRGGAPSPHGVAEFPGSGVERAAVRGSFDSGVRPRSG